MIDPIVTKVKGFFLNPVETFRQSINDEPGVVFTYFAAILLFHSILAAFVTAITLKGGIIALVVGFLMMLVGGFIFTILCAAWIHLWVYLLGGRKGIMQTFKAIIYGHTPRYILGWIPFIGFIFMIWSLALSIVGIRELQEMSTGKAILAVAIAVIIPLIIIIIVGAWFISSYMATTGFPMPPGNAFPTSVN